MKKKQQQQVIILSAVLAVIFGLLLYYFRSAFLPRPTGQAVVLTTPQRLLLPPRSATSDGLYDTAEYRTLIRDIKVPVLPVELNGSGSPFDDIFPERTEQQ